MNTDQLLAKAGQTETPRWGALSNLAPALRRGLLPLAMIGATSVVVVGLVRLIRLLLNPARFFLLQQALFAIILPGAVAFMVITYSITTRRILKYIEVWREHDEQTNVVAATITWMVVGLVLVCPILLALLLQVGV